MLELNKIYCMDCLEGMKLIDSNSIDLVVTSPPYDNLRDYTGELDWDFEIFKPIANELYRITKDGGIIVWIVGDATINGSESGSSFKQALYFKEIGFNLHDTMIFKKHNFVNPSSNRYHQIFEYMFIFTKCLKFNNKFTFNPIKDIINHYKYKTCLGKNTHRSKTGELIEGKKKEIGFFGMRNNIWEYKVGHQLGKKDDIIFKHPATFPLDLAKDNILSWSNKDDIVLDCFMGSGTTAVACKELQRNFIGFEISKEYCDIAEQRLEKWKGQQRLI